MPVVLSSKLARGVDDINQGTNASQYRNQLPAPSSTATLWSRSRFVQQRHKAATNAKMATSKCQDQSANTHDSILSVQKACYCTNSNVPSLPGPLARCADH